MTAKRCACVLAVVIAFMAVQGASVLVSPAGRTVIVDSPLSWSGADAGGSPQGLVPIQNMSLQVRVPPGKSFYLYFDKETETLKAMRLPDETAGLPPVAISAIDRSPNWIKDNLTRMFARLSQLLIDPTATDDCSVPAFADMNGDGAVDLVLADSSGKLTLYENIDPAIHYTEGFDSYINAVYVKDDTFFPPGVQPVGGFAHPAIGDLNGDNLPDIVLGGGDGKVYVFENAGPVGNPAWTAKGAVPLINVVANSAPALGDLDRDGDLDMIVGSASGMMYKSINNGPNPRYVSDGDPATVTNPVWAPMVTVDLNIPSFSTPTLADTNGDGFLEMVVGEGGGMMSHYHVVGTSWVKDTSMLSGFTAAARSAPALVDMDADTLPDLVTGCTAGPLRYYANVGTGAAAKFMLWQNYTMNFDNVNFNQYYWDANHVYLTHRSATQRLIDYSRIINTAPQKMVDEIAFSIASANAASLLNPAAFPEVYLNNTDSLYFNSQFTSYAQIMDYGLGTPDQWSTVRYLMNDSGNMVWYEFPRDIYYWWLVSLKGTDEMATFINPTMAYDGHQGARNQSNGGVFWRWAAFNLASLSWPADVGARGYPKEEPPPVLSTKIVNATVLWNNQTYSLGQIYNATGWFVRDAGGNITQPWNATNQAVEIVDHWVASTVPLNAQAGGDANRPRQPVRIQWEHNGNCGEISDMLWAGLRSALIPARGICGYGGDHCWGEFYERGWHQIDEYWDSSARIIANNDNYHYGWNRDWSGLMTMRGDGLAVDAVSNYHKTWDASNDAGFTPENEGLIDRANVTVVVVDAFGNPLDGVKVGLGDYRFLSPTWQSFGTQWTFTDAEGKAYLTTSEARQNNNPSNPSASDTFDDGIAIFVISKMGTASLGDNYAERGMPSYGDVYNPRNAAMNYYNFSLGGRLPRPMLPMSEVPPSPGGIYTLNVSFSVEWAAQHPAVGARWNEGLTYHELELNTGKRVTSFFAGETEFRKFMQWRRFEASDAGHNVTGADLSLGIPPGQDWYYVISNPGTLETTQVVKVSATLLKPPPEQRTFTVTPAMVGRHLMSIPLRPVDTDIGSVLGGILGSVGYVRWFDSSDAVSPWKSYAPGRAQNSLLQLDETMGFWIEFTGPCTWTVTGFPANSTSILLRSGWNLVGYPSSSATYTVGDLRADVGLAGVKVESFDDKSPPYDLWVLPDTYALRTNEGYWVYVPQDCIWFVSG